MEFRLKSSAFNEGEKIPNRFTCDGANISPPLVWSGAPVETKSFVLICDDPDAPRGTWTHWVVWNIPANTTEFPEHLSPRPMLENGAQQGMNDSNTIGYSGPCPPPGPPHRYFFTVYALDRALELSGHIRREQLLTAIHGRVLAEAKLMGRFGRE